MTDKMREALRNILECKGAHIEGTRCLELVVPIDLFRSAREALSASEGARGYSIQEIRGAVARGWCHDPNRNKEMDSDLAEAISQEVLQMLSTSPPQESVGVGATRERDAFRFAFWASAGPTNNAEFEAIERSEAEAWDEWIAASPLPPVRKGKPPPKLTEEEIVKLMRSAGFDAKTIKELTYTSWKDGIDIERPTTMTMKFVALIRTGEQT